MVRTAHSHTRTQLTLPNPAQLRRQTRLRREFLYTKSLEQKERQIWERKQRVKDLLAKGKEVPNGQGVGDREGKMDAGSEGEFAFSRSGREGSLGAGSLEEGWRGSGWLQVYGEGPASHAAGRVESCRPCRVGPLQELLQTACLVSFSCASLRPVS